MLQPDAFLTAVLPSAGFYCAVELSTSRRQHVFVEDMDRLDAAITSFSGKSVETYYAMASFAAAGSRKVENAVAVRSLFVDIDCGEGKAYPTKRAAVEALHKFLGTTGLDSLGAPWLVDSGGGVHAYWPLDEDTPIAAWLPVAEAFKRKAKELDFRIDMTVTADAARVLRPPGTINGKYSPPRPVVLRNAGATFSLKEIAQKLPISALAMAKAKSSALMMEAPLQLPGTPPRPLAKSAVSPMVTGLLANSVTMFKHIMQKTAAGKGCGQLAYYAEHAKEDGLEPLWRGLLSIAHKCEDGEKAAYRLSAMHPYPEGRTLQKLAEIKGPYPCTKFDSENPGVCNNCRHFGKITNPLALGRELVTDDAEKTFSAPPLNAPADAPEIALKRPLPPRGFHYGTDGSVFARKKEDIDGESVVKDVLIVPYPFFMVDMLQEDSVYMSRFAAIRKHSTVFLTVPNKAVGSKDEVIKALAAQNVISSAGSGTDKHLFDYVRACIADASVGDTALHVPPTFGWQPDGSFAISDTVIVPGKAPYTIVSEKLQNIINATAAKGTVGEWQKVIHMLQAKGQWDIVTMGCIGFGSPLMRWVDESTPGMVFHACGRQSGSGKTLALSLAASIWGSTTHYPVKPSTSERTMLQRAGLLGNCPLLLDEVTNNSRKGEMEWIPEYVFNFSQGGHKIKGNGASNTEMTNNLFWQSLSLITSNVPAAEHMMGARETSSEGEVRRMIEWHATEVLEWTAAERALLPLLGNNSGVAGRKYAEWLVNNVATAKKVLFDVMSHWRRISNAGDSERFWTAGCACVVAGAVLAGPEHANVCNIDIRQVQLSLMRMVKKMRAIIVSNQSSAEDVLNAYTREFHGQFVRLGPAQNGIAIFNDGRIVRPDSAKGRVAGRVEYDVTPGWVEYFIEITMLKRFCSIRNWSFLEFKKKLMDTHAVSEVRKDLLSKTGGPALRTNCLKISREISVEDE